MNDLRKMVAFNGKNRSEVLRFAYSDLSEDALVFADAARLPVIVVIGGEEVKLEPGQSIGRDENGALFMRCPLSAFGGDPKP